MISLPIHGSVEAPRIARHGVLSRLEGYMTEETAQVVALVVSELVTNSVLHADLGADDTVLVEIALGDDQVTIAVTDPGSYLVPRLLPRDSTRPHGFGLRLVDDISTSWGSAAVPVPSRCGASLTSLSLDPSGPSSWNGTSASMKPRPQHSAG